MSNLPKTACAYPFKAAMQMHGTPTTPCCRFHDRFLSEADKQLDHVDMFADIRETMLDGKWHPGCYKCKADEETKGSSMRTEADEFFTDFTDSVRLEYLEITVGRLCNLACMSCGFEFSHTWDSDSIDLELPSLYKLEHFKKHSELDLDRLDINEFQHLKYLKVTGGEPFLHQQFLRLITRLADANLAPNIEIEIFTNCTWWPKKADYDSLLQFKKLIITASIDAYQELNDILRHPSKWNVIESTLDKWIDMSSQYDGKVEVNIASTISVLNAPDMFDFITWARLEKKVPVILQTVYEPHYMSITHWPDWFKEKLQKKVAMQFKNCDKKLNRLPKLVDSLTSTNSVDDNSSLYKEEIIKLLELRQYSINSCIGFDSIINSYKQDIAWKI